jgi:hypothetical protein
MASLIDQVSIKRINDSFPKNLTGDLPTQDMRGIVSSIHDAKHSVKLEVKGG